MIDHIVYGVPRRLAQAVAWFAGLTGAQPARGGSHEGMGTANFLIGLAPVLIWRSSARTPISHSR